MSREIGRRVFDEKPSGECSVAQDFVFFIFEGTVKKAEKVVGMWSNSPFHAVGDLCDATNSSGTVVQ